MKDERKTTKEEAEQNLDALFTLLAKIGDKKDMQELFLDLCTYKEVEQMATRLKCAKLLKSGYTYNKVIEEVDISSATLARVSRCVSHGSGGYNVVLDKYNSEN